MNLFDAAVVVVAVAAAVGGHRLGLVARLLSWAGMALGAVVAARFLPEAVGRFGGTSPSGRLTVALGVLLGGAFLGQALGLLIGSRAHLALPLAGRPVDRVAGAAVGVAGVAVVLWLVVPSIAEVPGAPARLARGSLVARELTERTPPPPDPLLSVRRLVGDDRFPQVFAALRQAPEVGPPPTSSGLLPEVVARAAASTVAVRGRACDRIQEGSGFVVGEDVVVTNAHVVAGEERTEVFKADGERLDATVVAFDPDRDLAVLLVPGVAVAPLPIGDIEVGGTGAVLGHPGGGPLEVSPFAVRSEIEALGLDLYGDRETRRQVLVIAADLAAGDSGGPLVDADGEVVGVAFAIAPDREGTAYALTTAELRDILADADAGAADTGACIT